MDKDPISPFIIPTEVKALLQIYPPLLLHVPANWIIPDKSWLLPLLGSGQLHSPTSLLWAQTTSCIPAQGMQGTHQLPAFSWQVPDTAKHFIFLKYNTKMYPGMSYRCSWSLTIPSASAQCCWPAEFCQSFLVASSRHCHCQSTSVLWGVLSSQTRDENNSSPLSPKMRFFKGVTNSHLLENVGILNVSVAYTCESQNPENEGMEETFFPDSLRNELSILQGENETPGWEM